MQQKLSIGEMAKLRNITVDTLRHYDKIDLLKPYYTDPDTGYRYYTISQYEVLGTIKELQSVGLSLEDIKLFLRDRNLEKSIHSLKHNMAKIQEKITQLETIHSTLEKRLFNIEQFTKCYQNEEIVIKHFDEREYLKLPEPISWADKNRLYLGFLQLENLIGGNIPMLANNRFGEFIKKEYFDEIRQNSNVTYRLNTYYSDVFILVQDEVTELPTYKIEQGLFACSYYGGVIREKMLPQLLKLLDFCDKYGYRITGDAIRIMQVDISLTDQYDEAFYEIQIPVQKMIAEV